MSAVSAAADRQQLLRCGKRNHCRRRQQCPENAQQHERCNPPHAVSVHAAAPPRSNAALRYKTGMQLPPVIAAAIEVGGTVIASSARAARALRRLHGEAQRNRGLEAWQAPDILDWDSWLSRLWQKRLRSGSETRLLLSTLQEQQVWVRLVKPTIEGRRLISVLGVAELAQQAYALLCAYRALEFLRGERAGGPDVESFREWARGFEHTCSQEDWLSRSELPLVLHEAVLAGQVEATSRAGADRLRSHHARTATFDRRLRGTRSFCQDRCALRNLLWQLPPLLVEALDKRDEIADLCPMGTAGACGGGSRRTARPASRSWSPDRLQRAPGDREDLSPDTRTRDGDDWGPRLPAAVRILPRCPS